MGESLTRSTYRLASSQLVVNVGTTVLTFMLLRVAPPEDVAIIPLVLLLGSIVGVVLRLGSGTQILRWLPRLQENPEQGDGDRRVEDVLSFGLWSAVVGMVFLVPIVPIIGLWLSLEHLQDRGIGEVAKLLSVVLVYGASQNSPLWLQAVRDYRRLAHANAVSSLVEQVSVVVLYLLLGRDGLLLGLLLGRVVHMGYAYRCLSGLQLDRSRILRGALRPPRWIREGQWHLAANSFTRLILMRSDQIVIAAVLTSEDLAIYWVAYKLIAYVFIIAQSVYKPVVSEMAARFDVTSRLEDFSVRTGVTVAVAFGGVAAGVATISGWFLKYYGGSEYIVGTLAMVVLAAYSFAYVGYSLPQSVILASRDAPRLLKTESLAALVGLACTLAGGVFLGLPGVALGQLIGMLTAYAYSRHAVSPYVAMPSVDATFFRSGLLAMTLVGVAWLTGHTMSLVWGPLLALVVVSLYYTLQAVWVSRETVDLWTKIMPGPARRLLIRMGGGQLA